MAIIYAHHGDIVRVMTHGEAREFQVVMEGDEKEGEIRFEYTPAICESCGESAEGGYRTNTGRTLCAGCVERALVYQVMRDILYDIHRHNPNLAIAVNILNDDDIAMAKGTGPFVDSLSAGWDMLRANTEEERNGWFEDVIGAMWRNAFAILP